jgi:hypothetical protein
LISIGSTIEPMEYIEDKCNSSWVSPTTLNLVYKKDIHVIKKKLHNWINEIYNIIASQDMSLLFSIMFKIYGNILDQSLLSNGILLCLYNEFKDYWKLNIFILHLTLVELFMMYFESLTTENMQLNYVL